MILYPVLAPVLVLPGAKEFTERSGVLKHLVAHGNIHGPSFQYDFVPSF